MSPRGSSPNQKGLICLGAIESTTNNLPGSETQAILVFNPISYSASKQITFSKKRQRTADLISQRRNPSFIAPRKNIWIIGDWPISHHCCRILFTLSVWSTKISLIKLITLLSRNLRFVVTDIPLLRGIEIPSFSS